MQQYIQRINEADTVISILHIMAESLKAWVNDEINSKEYAYIKGYGDAIIYKLNT